MKALKNLLIVMQVYLMKSKKKQGNRNHILFWLHNLNDVPLLSHLFLFDLVCFVYSLETYLKLVSAIFHYF